MKRIILAAAALAASAAPLFAKLEPVAPAGGETVDMLTPEELAVGAVKGYANRIAWLKGNMEKISADADSKWRTAPRNFRFKWLATDNERGPWKIEISTDPSVPAQATAALWLEDWQVSRDRRKKGKPAVCRYYMANPNFLLGKEYHWRVTGNLTCARPGHGELWAVCPCGKNSKETVSKTASFRTADTPPRWIGISGRTKNIRDLGGWKTVDGRRIRQGMVFRGQGLNDNSVTGEVPGRNRLTVEDVKMLTGTLGIKTDLELRSAGETAGMKESPLGPGVKFVHNSSQSYKDVFTKEGRAATAANIRVLCDKDNYPVYFHCIAGADRTGALSYILLGLCGVDEDTLSLEWEQTFYPGGFSEIMNKSDDWWRRVQHLENGFSKYPGATVRERIEAYLRDCGITDAEMDTVRSILIEPAAR